MALGFSSVGDVLAHGFDDIIDVRSPAEFEEDRLPGAISLPVLDNDERARVGTIYKQVSPFDARKIGAAIVARNAARHIETRLADRDGSWRPLVYCWRGGQRSGAFAAILKEIGWRVDTVAGGYKSWRRLVVQALYEAPFPAPVVLIDGNTGTGKTDVLKRLTDLGVQTVDLEGLARHRGSFLGATGPQPTQKLFETGLAVAMAGLDPSRPVAIEAESTKIGAVALPAGLVSAMRGAPRIEIVAGEDARAVYLERAYADLIADPASAEARLRLLTRLRGRETVARWVDMLRAGEGQALARNLIMEHYDPAYRRSRARRDGPSLGVVESERLDDAGLDRIAAEIAGIIGRT